MPDSHSSRRAITRRRALQTAAVPLALAMQGRRAAAQTDRPNIVFLMADDLGYADLSCYGRRDYQTPNIDQLAAEGMRFLQAYANSSVCSATRTALITGRYQYRLEVGLEEPLQNGNLDVGLPPEHPTLPSLLKAAGYGTTLIGKWHLGFLPDYGPLKSGYDHFWGHRSGALDYFRHIGTDGLPDLWDGPVEVQEAGYLTDLIGERAEASIREYAAAGDPFLLSVHFNAPHWPWETPDSEGAAEAQRLDSIFDYDGGTLATYAGMVRELDLRVGGILDTLADTGIAGNTIVVFTSDNGGERFSDTWPFTGKKMELLEGGLRIPALIRWPGHVPAGSTTDQVAMTMDWLPTLLAAAGTAPDPAYPPDGINLLPMLTDGAPLVSRRVYWRYNANAQHAIREGDMKYLKIRDNTFLFNVVEDPLERANLKNRQPEVFNRLVSDYQEWNATMLPEKPRFGGGMTADHWADHIGNEPEGAPSR